MEEKLCKPHFRCVLKCVLDVTCLEMDIYIALLQNGEMDVNRLVKSLRKDRSNVYKSLKNLMRKGLISRKHRLLKTGGYKYLYFPLPFREVKEEIRRKLDEWIREVNGTLEEFDKVVSEADLLKMLEPKPEGWN